MTSPARSLTRAVFLFAALPLVLAGCGDDGGPLECGEHTRAMNGACVAELTCSAGTMLVSGECVPADEPSADAGVACEHGTRLDPANGSCVPAASACGAGTRLVRGQCVPSDERPDGPLPDAALPDAAPAIECAEGTVLDEVSGSCVVDSSACGGGATLADGVCVPDDQLRSAAADHVEADEPNDPGDDDPAGSFDAPARGATVTFYGCITPRDKDDDGAFDGDEDVSEVEADAPMVLEVTVDGLGGLSAGFVASASDPVLSPKLDSWQRVGIAGTGDTAQRQIYLPAAGTYALRIGDARELLLDVAAGSADACYFGSIRRVALPEPEAATLPSTPGSDDGSVRFVTYTAAHAGEIIDATQNLAAQAGALRPAFVTLRNGQLERIAVGTDEPPHTAVGGLRPGDEVTFVIDAEISYGVASQDYTLDLIAIGASALPTTGDAILVPERNNVSSAAYADLSYLYFDVTSPGIKYFNITSSSPIDMVILRANPFDAQGDFDYFVVIDAFGGVGRAAFAGEFVRFLAPGRYYFVTQNPAAAIAGGTYTITATVRDVPSTPLTLGSAVNDRPLSHANAFHSLDLDDPVWIEFGITATQNWGANDVSIEAYDLAAEGWLRSGDAPPPVYLMPGDDYPLFSNTQPSTAPFAPAERIVVGDSHDYLLRVKPTGTPEVGPTYSLLVRNPPNLTNLGAITPDSPATAAISALAPGEPARFIAFASSGSTVRSLAHPGSDSADIREQSLNVDGSVAATADLNGAGADETLAGVTGTETPWMAWTVENLSDGSSDVALTVTAAPARLYTITSGSIAFIDACDGGTTLGTGWDDDVFMYQTLPPSFESFELFGQPLPELHQVNSNGFMAWDPNYAIFSYANDPIPTVGAPEAMIAPFWQDLANVTLCRKDDAVANTVTYQWTGNVWQAAAQTVNFQLILHADGVIDFVYGPTQQSDGSYADTDGNGATVGVESVSGTIGQQILYDQALIAPNTSRTLVPQ